MDKGPTVPTWVLINVSRSRSKIVEFVFGRSYGSIILFWDLLTFSLAENTQMPQNLSVQFVCPIPKVLDFNEKRLHWVFVVHGSNKRKLLSFQKRVFMSWCCSCHSFVKCCFMFKYEHCEKPKVWRVEKFVRILKWRQPGEFKLFELESVIFCQQSNTIP